MDVPISRDPAAEPKAGGLMYTPEGEGPFPAVILMHGCGGLSKALQSLEAHARFLVKNGYAAFILDSFSKRGKSGGICFQPRESKSAQAYRPSDAFNTLYFIASLPSIDEENIFLMGQSHGGLTVLNVSDAKFSSDPNRPSFKAVVAYYPVCYLPQKLKYPVLVLGGEKDNWTPVEACLQANDKDLGKPYKAIAYKNAYHAFDSYYPVQKIRGNIMIGANRLARETSRKDMLAWFEKFRI
jgi:dienelactone hydrolase